RCPLQRGGIPGIARNDFDAGELRHGARIAGENPNLPAALGELAHKSRSECSGSPSDQDHRSFPAGDHRSAESESTTTACRTASFTSPLPPERVRIEPPRHLSLLYSEDDRGPRGRGT